MAFNDVVLTAAKTNGGGTAVVPEPITMASFLLAVAGLGAYVRKRKACLAPSEIS
jgi:hypothetical protein